MGSSTFEAGGACAGAASRWKSTSFLLFHLMKKMAATTIQEEDTSGGLFPAVWSWRKSDHSPFWSLLYLKYDIHIKRTSENR